MKIGLVTQAYYPIHGGVTEHVWHLGKELERRGHTVTVITGSSRHPDDRGLRVRRIGWQFPMSANGANVYVTWGWKLGRALQRIERQEQFDLVHIQSPLDPFLPLCAAKSMRTPKVGTHHTFRERHPLIERFPGIMRDAYDRVERHIAVSPAAEGLIAKYWPEAKMDIIPNGIDTDRFNPAGEKIAEFDDGVPTILFVGRMDPRKGAKYLLMALPYLEKAVANYRLVIVGSGWMSRYYDSYVPHQLRHRVRFMGPASSEDHPRYYRTADVFCSPATGGESFGIVLVEAMASGVPVVASDIDGYRWVIEPGNEGILVPPKSPRHLAEALAALINDPARRKQMGERGREKAMQYAWPKIVDRIEKVYREVLKK